MFLKLEIKRVLVGTDFSPSSEKALRHAIVIARSYGAKFYLVHVVSSLGLTIVGPDAVAMAATATERDMQETEERLLRSGALEGIPHETVVRKGEIWQELERIVEYEHVDLIVVGTHGRSGLRKFALGSVAEAVFRHATCPVLTVGPCAPAERAADARLHHILYPTDFSQASTQAASYAISLAIRHRAHLTIIHVAVSPEAVHGGEQKGRFEDRFREATIRQAIKPMEFSNGNRRHRPNDSQTRKASPHRPDYPRSAC